MNPHVVNQLARDIAAIVNEYLGPQGELVMDTSAGTLRLHDGVERGGLVFLPLNLTDARYQQINSFLSMILAQEDFPGFLYVGPTNVGTRALAFSSQFTTDNGTFPSDPFAVTLNQTQSGDWVFGTVTASTFTGSLVGPSNGTHTGPVNGNLSGNSTGTHTGPSNGLHTGAVDIRGAALQLDNNQIPDAALSNAIQALLVSAARIPPRWSIMLWDTARPIPTGWQECDGTNGTVDLRGFFPVGASAADPTFAAGQSGGAKTHNHGTITSSAAGAHSHTLNVSPTALTVAQLPSHDHPTGLRDDNVGNLAVYGTVAVSGSGGFVNNAGGGFQAITGPTGSGEGHTHGGDTATASTHTHTTVTPAADNLPPFKAIRFIQYVAA